MLNNERRDEAVGLKHLEHGCSCHNVSTSLAALARRVYVLGREKNRAHARLLPIHLEIARTQWKGGQRSQPTPTEHQDIKGGQWSELEMLAKE